MGDIPRQLKYTETKSLQAMLESSCRIPCMQVRTIYCGHWGVEQEEDLWSPVYVFGIFLRESQNSPENSKNFLF